MEEKIVEKLRKILALTESPVEAEAALAASKLQELLTAHNLSMADLEKRGGKATPAIEQRGHDLGKAAFKWKLDLAEAIAQFYFCHPLVNRDRKTVAFIGRKENVETLEMLYAWVIQQIKQIATAERRVHYDSTGEHIDPLRWQIHFGVGAVERLEVRLTEMQARRQEDANDENSVALVVLNDARQMEINDYLEENFGYRRDGKETKVRRESRLKYEANEARLEKLRETDIEAYCAECPWERPETDEEKAEREKREKAERKKEEARQRRRDNYIPTGGGRRGKAIDWDKEDQGETATRAGHRSADRINLQPFVTDGKKPKGEIK
jgi:hypothetical protein